MPITSDTRNHRDQAGRPYAVLGATGQQGVATVQAPLSLGPPVREILRTPTSPAASALAARGVHVVTTDQEDGAGAVPTGTAAGWVRASQDRPAEFSSPFSPCSPRQPITCSRSFLN